MFDSTANLDRDLTSRIGSVLRFETSRPLFQNKYEQVQKNLGEVEKRLEEAQQKIQLNDLERSHTGGGESLGTMGSDTGEQLSFFSFIHSFARTEHLQCSRCCIRG